MATILSKEAGPAHVNKVPQTDVCFSGEGRKRKVKLVSANSVRPAYFSITSCFINRDEGIAEITTRSGLTKVLNFTGLTEFEILAERRQPKVK